MASSPGLCLHRTLAAAPTTTRGQATQLSADAEGQRIAYASGKSIFVRSIDDPADCKQYTGHTAATTVARFAPDGFKVASGDAAGALRVWEPASIDTTRGEYGILAGRLHDVAWDGDSQRVMAVGDGKETFGRCITADSGNSVGEVIGHAKAINAVAMKAQRPFRAATVGDDATMVFYHGAPYKFSEKSALHKGFVLGAAFSPDGGTLATVGADRTIQLYDGKTGQPLRQVGPGEHSGSIFAVAWSQDSKSFATASADQTVKLWSADDGSLIQSWRFGDGVSVRDQQVGVVIPFSRSDGLIISVNMAGELIYLHRGKPSPVRVLQGHNRGITAMTASSPANGSPSIWTGSFDGHICRWDATTGLAASVDGAPHTNQVAQLAASKDRIYSASWDDTVKIIDQSSNTALGQAIKLPAQPKGAAASDTIIFVATASAIAAYAGATPLHETPLDYTPGAVAVSGSLLAVGAEQNQVRVYQTDREGRLEPLETLTNPTGTVSALAFSGDARHLAAGNSVGKIYVFATATWELVTDRWSAHTARVTCIAWDGSGAYAASGSLDTNLFVWCLEKKNQGKRIKAANAHKEGVNGVAWIGRGQIASAGGDAAVKIWEVRNLP